MPHLTTDDGVKLFYEETGSGIPIVLVLWNTRRRGWGAGKQFGLYCLLTGLERFIVEFWRRNDPGLLGLTVAQQFGIGVMVLGAVLYLRPRAAR